MLQVDGHALMTQELAAYHNETKFKVIRKKSKELPTPEIRAAMRQRIPTSASSGDLQHHKS
jgi:hypothetical protein